MIKTAVRSKKTLRLNFFLKVARFLVVYVESSLSDFFDVMERYRKVVFLFVLDIFPFKVKRRRFWSNTLKSVYFGHLKLRLPHK